MSKWISFDDELPPKNSKIECGYIEEKKMFRGFMAEMGECEESDLHPKSWNLGDYSRLGKVTHWRLLPWDEK